MSETPSATRAAARVRTRKTALLASVALIAGSGAVGLVVGAAAFRAEPAAAQSDGGASRAAPTTLAAEPITLAQLAPQGEGGYGFAIEGDDGEIVTLRPSGGDDIPAVAFAAAQTDDGADDGGAAGGGGLPDEIIELFTPGDGAAPRDPAIFDGDADGAVDTQFQTEEGVVDDLDGFGTDGPLDEDGFGTDRPLDGDPDGFGSDDPLDADGFGADEPLDADGFGSDDPLDADGFGSDQPLDGADDFLTLPTDDEPGLDPVEDAADPLEGFELVDPDDPIFVDPDEEPIAGDPVEDPGQDLDADRGDGSLTGIGGGVDLGPSAAFGAGDPPARGRPGECFARLYIPGAERVETRTITVREETFELREIPAVTETRIERVVLEEGYVRLTLQPPVFREEIVRIETRPAQRSFDITQPEFDERHEDVQTRIPIQAWRPGRGPLEIIDEATGEIMCRVVLPAETERFAIQELVTPPSADPVDSEAEFATFTTRVVETPARVLREQVEPVFEDVEVIEVVEPARVVRRRIPAETREIQVVVGEEDGRFEWRPILCETNVSRDLIRSIQRSLRARGFDAGPVDGRYGPSTEAAVEAFQRARGLPEGGLTLETLDALEVARP